MGLDVAMADSKTVDVVESSEDLESDELDIKSVESLFPVILDVVEQVTIVEIHYNTQVLTPVLEGSISANDFHDKLSI